MEPIRSQDGLGPFAEAFASVKKAKNFFWWILLLCLLVQLAGFIMVRFTHLIVPAQASAATPAQKVTGIGQAPAASEPASQATTATSQCVAAKAQVAHRFAAAWAMGEEPCPREKPWYHVFRYALPATMFLCIIVGLLLILTLMWTVKLALLARVAGVEGYIGAFFWSLVFWVLVVPWQHVMHADMLVGVPFNLDELLSRTCEIIYSNSGSRLAEVFYYCRFAVYPVIAIVILGIIQSKFSSGYKRTTYSASSDGGTPATPAPTPKL